MSRMSRERFESLAEAYGGQIARWPDAERDAAALLAVAEPEFAAAVLARGSALDAALEQWTTPAPDAALTGRILTAASVRPPRGGLVAWLWRAGLGAGLAAACAAGLLAGFELAPAPNAGEEVVASVMASFDGLVSEDV